MKKVNLFLFVLINGLVFSQNPSIVPDNVPGAYIDYQYSKTEINIDVDVDYRPAGMVPRLTIPPNSNNTNKDKLLLDVYYGINNNVCLGKRPLIIFSPSSENGGNDKSEHSYIKIDLARRGYIVASIKHRNGDFSTDQIRAMNKDSIHPILTLTAAMDLHIATQFFINNASTYNIDPNYIILAGGSFGAITALHAAFMNKNEFSNKFGQFVNVNDTFFSEYNSSLQSSNIKGVVSLMGAVYDLGFITSTETTPVFMFHGNKDPLVPYKTNNFGYNYCSLECWVPLSGSGVIANKIKMNNNSFYLVTGKEVGHTFEPVCNYPESNFPAGYPMYWYPQMLSFLKNSVLCNQLNQKHDIINCTYPECSIKDDCKVLNPLSGAIQVSTPVTISSLPISSCTSSNLNEHCNVFSFDGGDYLYINNYTTLNSITNDYTVEFWYKKSGTLPSNIVTLLFRATKLLGKDGSFGFGLKGDNNIWINTTGPALGEGAESIIPIPPIDNNWHHYKIYFTTSGNVSVKIDNSIVLPTTLYTELSPSFIRWFLGGHDGSYNGVTLQTIVNSIGLYDEFRIWKGIAAFNNNSTNNSNICPLQSDLLAYYKLNFDGQSVKDETNYHHDGTKGATTSIESSDPTFTHACSTSARIGNASFYPFEFVEEEDVITGHNNTKEILSIYPNPSKQAPHIAFISKSEGQGILQVVDSEGYVIVNNVYVDYKIGLNLLSNYLPALTSGEYFVKLKTNNSVHVKKFTIIN